MQDDIRGPAMFLWTEAQAQSKKMWFKGRCTSPWIIFLVFFFFKQVHILMIWKIPSMDIALSEFWRVFFHCFILIY